MSRRRPQNLRETLPGLGRILACLWPYLRKSRPLVSASIGILLLGIVLRLLEPWPLKFVFDRIIPVDSGPAESASWFYWLQSLPSGTLLLLAALAVIGITGARALSEYAVKIGFAKIGNRVLADVRRDLYNHLLRLSLSFHGRARSGDLTVRVINDVNLLRDVVITAVLPLAASLLVLIGMWSVMLWLQWKLALVALCCLPLLFFRTLKLTDKIRQAARKQRKRQSAMAATAAESITSIQIVQALSLEKIFGEGFASRNSDSQKQDVKTAKLSASLGRSVDIVRAIATALVLWYGTHLVLQSQLSPGDLLVFLTYLRRALNPVQDFAKYTGRLAKAAAAGERVLELLDRQPEVRDLPEARPAPRFQGGINFENVSFSYEPGEVVLHRVSFSVRPGEQVALVGPSGIGKSTIAALILRLYDPQEGRILIDECDIRHLTLTSFRSQISAVLQDSLLFAGSVRENIAYGRPGCDLDDVEEAARLASASDFIRKLPQGYDTIIGERGVTLSGGQRRRIAIARAAVRDAPILILDEPTTGLDEENYRTVVEALQRLAARRTTFIIGHDLQLSSAADLILHFEGGRIVEQGNHQDLLELNGSYARLYRLQTSPLRQVEKQQNSGRVSALR